MSALEQEARIRGLFAAVSADIEGLLLRIILYCIIDKPNVAFHNFKNMTLGGNLQWAIKDLKQYDIKRYLKHKEDFDWLKKFNTIRGQLIHCDIIKHSKDFLEFTLIDIQLINKEWRIVQIKHTKLALLDQLFEFKKVILRLADTCKEMIEEVQFKYPDLIKVSKSS